MKKLGVVIGAMMVIAASVTAHAGEKPSGFSPTASSIFGVPATVATFKGVGKVSGFALWSFDGVLKENGRIGGKATLHPTETRFKLRGTVEGRKFTAKFANQTAKGKFKDNGTWRGKFVGPNGKEYGVVRGTFETK